MRSSTCRFGCNDRNKFFDAVQRKMVDCPDCAEERKDEVRRGEVYVDGDLVPLTDVVGMADSQTYNYDLNQILPNQVRSSAISGLDDTIEALDVVHNSIILGNNLENSYCFGLPNGSKLLQLGFSFLVDAYKSNISIAPMVASHQYHTFLQKDVERVYNKKIYYDELKQYEGLYTADLAVVVITSGGNSSVINTCKGLMQSRAISGLPTVFLTSKPTKDLIEIVEGDERFNTALGFAIQTGYGDYDQIPSSEISTMEEGSRSVNMEDLSLLSRKDDNPLEFNQNRTKL